MSVNSLRRIFSRATWYFVLSGTAYPQLSTDFKRKELAATLPRHRLGSDLSRTLPIAARSYLAPFALPSSSAAALSLAHRVCTRTATVCCNIERALAVSLKEVLREACSRYSKCCSSGGKTPSRCSYREGGRSRAVGESGGNRRRLAARKGGAQCSRGGLVSAEAAGR